MTDELGNDVFTDSYWSFGQATEHDQGFDKGYMGAWDIRQAYLGEPITNAGISLMGVRPYSADLGRFIARDPTGLSAGTNVYAYVFNRPTDLIDPSGLGVDPGNGPQTGGPPVPASGGSSPGGQEQDPCTHCGGTGLEPNRSIEFEIRLPSVSVGEDWDIGPFEIEGAIDVGSDGVSVDGDVIVEAGPIDVRIVGVSFTVPFTPSRATPNPSRLAQGMRPTPGFGNFIVCLKKGTLIHTDSGLVPIEEIQLGTCVKSMDMSSGTIQNAISEGARQTGLAWELVRVQTEGDVLEMTSTHPVWTTNRGWVRASKLETTDLLMDKNGNSIPILDLGLTDCDELIPVYDVKIPGLHNYFVGHSGLLLHNS